MNHVNDPKWTAFVLNALETPDKDFIEEVLERDPFRTRNRRAPS